MKKKLIFNDISSEDMGLVIQTAPTYEFPNRDVTKTHVPGKNGDLVQDNKCYNNVKRTYSLAMGFTTTKHFMPNAEAVLEWLTSANGRYAKLMDDYDPNVYRLAMYINSGSFSNYYDQALVINAEFECKPQRYLVSGDIPKKYNSSHVEINNPTHYGSKPLLKIEGIESTSNILMVSVKDETDNDVSTITINDTSESVIAIDSEEENCYGLNGDVNEKISLNGKNFPILNKNKNTINIKEYTRNYGTIQSYNSIISNYQNVVETKYSPKQKLIEMYQNKYFVKSYSSLIDSKKETHDCNSFQALAEETGVSYTFESINNLITNFGNSFSFTGKASNIISPDWLSIEDSDADNDRLVLKAGKSGYFRTTDDSFIRYIEANSVIATVKNNITTTVYFNRCTDVFEQSGFDSDSTASDINFPYWCNGKPEGLYKVVIRATEPGYYRTSDSGSWTYKNPGVSDLLVNYMSLDDVEIHIEYCKSMNTNHTIPDMLIGYDDVPNCFAYDIIYDDTKTINGTNYRVPVKVVYLTNQNGYFWTDKTGIFGKASWNKMNGGTVILELPWSSSKKAFVNSSGLLSSTNVSLTFKYNDGLTATYNDTVFEATTLDSNFKEITLKASNGKKGFYSLSINEKEPTDWVFKEDGEQISKIKGTDSFSLYFIPATTSGDVPTYEDDPEFPDWLDPKPVLGTNGNPLTNLNPASISFKVRKNSLYRYSLTDSDNEYSSWSTINSNGHIVFSPSKTIEDSFFVCQIDTLPSEFNFDRTANSIPHLFTLTSESINDQLPHWLTVELDEDTLEVSAVNDGYYKVDEGSWTQKSGNGTIATFDDWDETSSHVISFSQTNPINTLPNWLNSKWFENANSESEINSNTYDSMAQEDKDKVYVTYYAGASGYFRWGTNGTWLKKNSGDTLVSLGNVEDISIYYMPELPNYTTFIFDDLIDITPVEDSVGNPVEVIFTMKSNKSGYFRVNSNSDWEWYGNGKELLRATVGSTNSFNHLVEVTDTDDLDNITITVTPRWWML